MKKFIYFFTFFNFCLLNVSAQVAIGTSNPDASSLLDLNAINKGLLIPRHSNSSLLNINNPQIGLIIFNTDSNEIQTNNGTIDNPIWSTRAKGAPGDTGPIGLTGNTGVLNYVPTGNPGVVSGTGAYIAGGTTNTASGPDSTVIGGIGNTASGNYSTSEGNVNTSSGPNSTIVGGSNNASSLPGASVGGGIANAASGSNGTVVGGNTNVASMPGATNIGGYHNTSSASGSTLIGGNTNTSSGVNSSIIGGGFSNASSGVTASISGGGSFNNANAVSATVCGGSNSTASGVDAIVSGGNYMVSPSFGEWSGGIYGTNYVFNSATASMSLDRVFNIGIGSNSTFLKDGLTILKDGTSTLPYTSISLILSSSDKAIITKEYLLYKEIKTISATSYTLLQSDCSKILQFTSNSSIEVIVPFGLKLNSKFEGKQIGSGQITFLSELSVNLQKAATDKLKTLGQYSTFKINSFSMENYLLSGKLEAL